MSTLPPEIISDILCRLPVKPLLRFRCTSKDFCSTIDGPDFTKLHLHCTTQTHSHRSLILTSRPLRSVDLDSLERSVEIEHPMKTVQCKTEVIGSCNGLLCLFNTDSEIMLWNMSTRKHHRVPFVPIVFPNEALARYTHQVAYGFGHDSVHDDYKLVRIVRFRFTLDSEVMVYSLKSNSWKKKVEGFRYDFHLLRPICEFADGALHWLVKFPGEDSGLISGFDLAAEEFRNVPLPPVVLDGESEVQMRMGNWESHFCVICHCAGKLTNMYVLLMDSWANSLSTKLPQVTGSVRCVMPMAHSSNGNEILILKNNEKFLWYDLKSNKVKNVKIHDLPKSFEAMLYVESLVNPLPLVNGVDEAVGKPKSDGGKKNAKKRDNFLSAGFKLKL